MRSVRRDIACSKHTLTPSLSHTYTLTEAKYGVEVMVIAVDFSYGQEIYPQLVKQLKNLDIGVLGIGSIRDRAVGDIHLSMVLPLIPGL